MHKIKRNTSRMANGWGASTKGEKEEKNQQQQNKSKNEPNIVWYVDSFDDVNDERIICVLLYVNTLIKSLNSNYISNYLLDSK